MEGRKQAHALLSNTTLDDYLSTRPPAGVVTLPGGCSLAAALRRLAASNILSAPLVDDSGASLGFVDVMDILSAVFERNEWGAGGLAAFLQTTALADIPRANDAQMVYRTHGGMPLLEVCRRGFVAPEYKLWCHRLAIFDAADASGVGDVEITGIFSQSDVARFLHAHADFLPALMATPLAALGLGRKPVFSVPADLPAAAAFRAMLSSGATATAVVDAKGRLVGNLSPSDLRGLAPESLGRLDLPVAEFLAGEGRASGSPRVAGSLADTYGVWPRGGMGSGSDDSGGGAETAPGPAACGLNGTMGEVLDLMVDRSVHRVYLLDPANGDLAGVVSLSDVLAAVVGP